MAYRSSSNIYLFGVYLNMKKPSKPSFLKGCEYYKCEDSLKQCAVTVSVKECFLKVVNC